MRKVIPCLVGIVLGAGTMACVRVAVETTLAPGTDLARYSTFAQAPPAWPHPVVGERIETEIAKLLQQKGYRLAPQGQADLVVSYGANGERRSRLVNAADPDVDIYTVESYIAGTVEIDVFDGKKQELLWEGVGKIDIRKETDAQRAAGRAVRAILAKFPDAS